MSRIEDITRSLIQPYLEGKDIEIVDVEYVKEGKEWHLKVYIDKPGGVTLNDCEDLSRYLSDRLDEVDPIKNSYILEVSSPGVERPLKRPEDYERFKGQKAYLRFYQQVDGKKEIVGVLKGYSEGNVYVEVEEGKDMLIPLDKISSARLYFEF
ncbi:ribosome maturation factor RimP [Caldanaerobius polysaccharolyticus]|uniref:ribosome maturation factor RimP n=1 Tax=Caldanaerobius polysaccharolyticus TaxID=44256 RepID=UPI00047D8B33|nr:ribosome maturation factor RimP [Caldanaerobius polysaccharolyticus]